MAMTAVGKINSTKWSSACAQLTKRIVLRAFAFGVIDGLDRKLLLLLGETILA